MATIWDVLKAATKYDGNPDAHSEVIKTLKKKGHTVKSTASWSTETVMAYFYDAGAISLIGGYATDSKTIKKNAKKIGIWHDGSFGILPGDVVVYGSTPNHAEFAVGFSDNISGNYNGGCTRRKRTGRTINGYARPKYQSMPVMNNLQIAIAACDVMLGVYGSGDARSKNLAIFGKSNAEAIQKEVTRVWGEPEKISFDFALYIICGHAGKKTYRKTRLGSFYASGQSMVNYIYALYTRSKEQAALDVIAGKYGTGEICKTLLTFNGYNVEDVLNIANTILDDEKKPPDIQHKFRIYPIWFFEKDESAYGDCTAIIEFDSDGKTVLHCVLIDTAMAKVSGVVVQKLKALGVKTIDLLLISHGHGDHYGGTTNINKSIPIKKIVVPDCTELDKYQKTYGNALRRQAAKASNSQFFKIGDTFEVGGIKGKCLWMVSANSLKEKDSHHFVNNLSMYLSISLGDVIFNCAGDMQNEANNILVEKKNINLNCHVSKFRWHGDANANNKAIAKAESPLIIYSDYHHKERSGRGTSRKRYEEVGATVYRNAEDGDIFIDCFGTKITVTTSKSGKHDTFTVQRR